MFCLCFTRSWYLREQELRKIWYSKEMAILIFAIITLIVGVVSHYLWIWTYWRRRGLAGPMGLPLIGSVMELNDHKTAPYAHIQKWTRKYGKVYGITSGVQRFMVISDPDLVNEVFVRQFDKFYGRNLNAFQGDPDQGKLVNIFTAQAHRWKRLRTIATPSFSGNSLRKVKETVEDCAFELIGHIERKTGNGEAIDVLAFFQEFTMDVISRVAVGQDQSMMFQNPLLKNVRAVFGEDLSAFFNLGAVAPFAGRLLRKFFFSLPSSEVHPMVNVFKAVTDAVNKRVQQRELDAKNGIEGQEPSDYIDFFLDARSDEDLGESAISDFTKSGAKISRQLTIDEVVSQCVTFIVAGFDTTALALSYTAFLLATNPRAMKKLQDEIERECPNPSISFDELTKLKYMDWVLKESLRLFPLGNIVIARRCMQSTKIGEYDIEEGTGVLADSWTMHHDKEIWGDDVEEFRPERWENGGPAQKCAYAPFGLGPRQCIGMRLAYMEERLLLAQLLRKFDLAPTNKTEIPLKLYGRMSTQPKHVFLNIVPKE